MSHSQLSEEAIFEAAFGMVSPAARMEYLQQVCQGDEQIHRILALLKEGAPESSFLEHGPSAKTDLVPVESPKRIGDFEILGELGRGGMGVVYRARQCSLDRLVALKVLSTGLGLTTKAIMRFKREAEAAAKLHHTNIVPVYWTGDENRVPYYAMELVDGPSMDQVIRQLRADRISTDADSGQSTSTTSLTQTAPVPAWVEETVGYQGSPMETSHSSSWESSSSLGSATTSYCDNIANMMAGVADALAHAHDHGIIHRDIKPANLLLSSDGRLSINDFGLARMLEQPGMTMTGEFMGSPMYMSPEQIAAGRLPLDHRTDIYSLGASLYQMLTLEPPFPGQQRDQVLSQIIHKDPPRPRTINKRIPKDLETICLKAMEKDPDARYPTAEAMAHDLRAFVHRHAISARRIGPVERTVRWAKRHRSLATAICLAVILGCVAMGIYAKGRWDRAILVQQHNAKERDWQMNDALVAAVSGNEEKTLTHIQNAQRLGAPDAWAETMKCQLALAQGKNTEALRHIQSALDLDKDNVMARAMQADVYYNNGQWWEYLRALSGLQDVELDSPESRLFLARARAYLDPAGATGLIDQAIEESRSQQPVYFIASARFRAFLASEQRDRKVLNEALRHASLATGLLPDNPVAHSAELLTRTTAAVLDTSGRPLAESEHLKNAAENVEILRQHPTYFEGRNATAGYYFLLNDPAQAEAAMIGDGEPIQGFGSATLVSSAYMQDQHGDKLRQALAQLDQVQPKTWIIQESRLMLMLGIPGEYQRAIATLNSVMEQPGFGSDGQDDRGMIDFLWILGEKDKAQKTAQNILDQFEELDFWPFAQARLKFYAEENMDTRALLDAAGNSRRDLGIAHFAIGVRFLADGDRANARFHFEQSASEGHFFWRDVALCRTILRIMERQGADWPTWISKDSQN